MQKSRVTFKPQAQESQQEQIKVEKSLKEALDFYKTEAKSSYLQAKGCRLHVAQFNAPNEKAICLVMPGWSECVIKYCELIKEFVEQGISVVAYDHRSQGFSERPQFLVQESLSEQNTHVEDFHMVISDALLVYMQCILPRLKQNFYILGFSMGGLVASNLASCVPCTGLILISPCLRPRIRLVFAWFVKLLRFMGQGEKFIPKPQSADDKTPAMSRDTSSTPRKIFWEELMVMYPEICINGLSIAHIDEMFNSQVDPMRLAKRLQTNRVLILSAENELYVDNSRINELCDRLDEDIDVSYRHVHILDSKHEILQERDEIRNHAVEQVLDFLLKGFS